MKQNNQWKTPLHQPASSLRLRLQRMVKTLKVLVCGIVHNPNELIRSMLNMLLARKDKPSKLVLRVRHPDVRPKRLARTFECPFDQTAWVAFAFLLVGLEEFETPFLFVYNSKVGALVDVDVGLRLGGVGGGADNSLGIGLELSLEVSVLGVLPVVGPVIAPNIANILGGRLAHPSLPRCL